MIRQAVFERSTGFCKRSGEFLFWCLWCRILIVFEFRYYALCATL